MTAPTPRPALKKSADAHIHPAAPGHSARSLRAAADPVAADPAADPGAADVAPDAAAPPAVPLPRSVEEPSAEPPGPRHRLSGPLHGTTSDGLRAAAKGARGARRRGSEDKAVELTVKVPKSLRKEFRAAVKADKQDPDEVVTTLLRAWLRG